MDGDRAGAPCGRGNPSPAREQAHLSSFRRFSGRTGTTPHKREREEFDMSLGCRRSGIAVVSLVALLNLSASGPAWSYADAFTWKLVDGGPDTAEIRKCHDYIAAHPDFAKGYGSISMDSYCSCQ